MVRFFIILTLLLFSSISGTYAAGTKNVWVLHSYHQGWPWTDHITKGIQSVFSPFGKEILIYYDYLDLHRASDDALADAATYFQRKLDHIAMDVIIVSDDGALQFLDKYGDRLAPGTPVVFCGINSEPQRSLFGDRELTGVVEQIDHLGALDLMLRLHPECRRIVALVDRKAISPFALDELEKAIAKINQRVSVDTWQDIPWSRMPAKLVALTPGDLVYLLGFDHDRSGNAAIASEVADLVVRWSPVAVYTPLDLYLGRGVVGGLVNSGSGQGAQAGRMALRVLSGEAAADIPVADQVPHPYLFDGRALQRFDIDADQVPEQSEIIHQQPVFWLRHGIFFVCLVAALLLLSSLLLLLLMRQRSKQSSLVQINTDLDGRIREKSVHLQIVNQKLKKQSLTDGVTGIPNRRYIYQRLVEEIKKARRYNVSLALVLFDIDGFKKIYDQHGYVLGERILRDVGHTIKRNMREIDLVGRYGGEAFLVILPNTTLEQARCTAERVRKKIAGLSWEQGEVKVTVSGGLTQFVDQTPPELVQRVDDLLDAAKGGGGNRIADGGDTGSLGGGVIPLPEFER